MGAALESIYGSNISPSGRLPLKDLVSGTLDVSLQLSHWRNSNPPSYILAPSVDFGTWSAGQFEAERYSILRSIFYYRTVMVVHGSLLMGVLGLATSGSPELSSGVLQETIKALLRDNFSAVTQMHHLIRGILRHNRLFLKSNAIWWACNYACKLTSCPSFLTVVDIAALTVCLHLFAYWVGSNNASAGFIALDIDCFQLESQLRDCLDTLKAIGVASAMSVKAHRCLHRHLHFLSTKCACCGGS